jgi:hypothetical protein
MDATPNDANGNGERPAGVYLVAFYFVLTGFLSAIRSFHESEHAFSLSPFADNSIWSLGADPVITLGLAFLIWHFASLGRLAALVYGYVILVMHAAVAFSYFFSNAPLTLTPLQVGLAAFDVLTLPVLIAYLQPARQKRLFRASVWEILVSSD